MSELNPSVRLYSLDALRGFDMLWIMGGEEIFHGLAKATGSPFWDAISNQFTHPEWNGFHVYDLIFPLFLFIAGVATPYSVGRAREKGQSSGELVRRVVRRGLILVILGIIYNNGLMIQPLAEIRFPSVLGRIGLAYMFANIIYIYTEKEMTRIIWFGGLLIGYWLLLMFTSAPGFPMGDLTIEGNFASYIDRSVIPGHLYVRDIHDPEGLISTIPAIATGLLGIIAGTLLRSNRTGERKATRLAIAGVIFLAGAQLWNLVFPINKNLWTSSFVLQTGGLSLLLLAIFYYIIDVKGYKNWAFFFTIIGMNSILIYMSGEFINWSYTTKAFFQWLFQLISDPWNDIFFALCFIGIKWLFLYILYKKKIFLKV